MEKSETVTARWRRLDQPGGDIARLEHNRHGWHLRGTAVWISESRPAQLDYTVQLTHEWTTTAGTVHGFIGERSIDLTIDRTAAGWTLNGHAQAAVQPLRDLDYGFTPATNLQPLRRMNLKVGETATLSVAWLEAGSSQLVVLPQTYCRTSTTTYAYEAPTVPYRATLQVGKTGFVRDYPGLWVEE